MSEYINMGPGNFSANGQLTAPGQPVAFTDAAFRRFAEEYPARARQLCRRGCTVREMQRELKVHDAKAESREARRLGRVADAILTAEQEQVGESKKRLARRSRGKTADEDLPVAKGDKGD